MVAEQTLATQRRPDRVIDERALSLPANGASEGLRGAEIALGLAQDVQGQGLAASAAGQGDAEVARDLVVDGGESRVAEVAQLRGFDEQPVAQQLFMVGGEDALDLQGLEAAFRQVREAAVDQAGDLVGFVAGSFVGFRVGCYCCLCCFSRERAGFWEAGSQHQDQVRGCLRAHALASGVAAYQLAEEASELVYPALLGFDPRVRCEVAGRRGESVGALCLRWSVDLDSYGALGIFPSLVEVLASAKVHQCDFAGQLPRLCKVDHAGLCVDLDIAFEYVLDVGEIIVGGRFVLVLDRCVACDVRRHCRIDVEGGMRQLHAPGVLLRAMRFVLTKHMIKTNDA